MKKQRRKQMQKKLNEVSKKEVEGGRMNEVTLDIRTIEGWATAIESFRVAPYNQLEQVSIVQSMRNISREESTRKAYEADYATWKEKKGGKG